MTRPTAATRSVTEGLELDRRVRAQIYEHLVEHARAPAAAEVAAAVGTSAVAVESSYRRLADAHAIALRPDSADIWMAHPFSAVPTAYPVETARHTYWANCAWDALGIPALLGIDAETRTTCADCGAPLVMRVRNGELESDGGFVHFLVPPARFWDDVGFT